MSSNMRKGEDDIPPFEHLNFHFSLNDKNYENYM